MVEAGLAINLGLPAALCIIMLGLGLSLQLDDFVRILAKPRPVIVGLACQAVILPLICLAMVTVSDLPPAVAVGMMLLAASPGGTSSSLFTHLAGGDVALTITLAAINSVLAMATVPIIANGSLLLFYGRTEAVTLDLFQVLQFFLIAIVPAMIGVFIRSRHPGLARRLERPVRLLATLFLLAVVGFALVSHWDVVLEWGPVVGGTALAFNLVSLAVGYYVPLLFGIEQRQAIAIAMAIAIHNAALVITLAVSETMLNNSEMAIPPALYGLIAYGTGALAIWLYNTRLRLAQ